MRKTVSRKLHETEHATEGVLPVVLHRFLARSVQGRVRLLSGHRAPSIVVNKESDGVSIGW